LPTCTFLKCFGYVEHEDILKLSYKTATASLGRTTVKIGTKSFDPHELAGRYVAADAIDPDTGEILVEACDELSEKLIDKLMNSHVKEIQLLDAEQIDLDATIVQTVRQDTTPSQAEAYREVYARIRPGDPATDTTTKNFFERLFFDPSRYDFAPVGR